MIMRDKNMCDRILRSVNANGACVGKVHILVRNGSPKPVNCLLLLICCNGTSLRRVKLKYFMSSSVLIFSINGNEISSLIPDSPLAASQSSLALSLHWMLCFMYTPTEIACLIGSYYY